MINKELKAKANKIPRKPGIYKFKDSAGKVIYVGKAKVLRERVKSYFQKIDKRTKTAALVSNIADIEYIETLSEIEALILEAELIKTLKPRYNVALKDDKSYIYIVIRNEFVDLDGKITKLPKVLAARKTDVLKDDVSFGPFPDTRSVRYVIRVMRRALPFRDCSTSKFNRYNKLNSPCLFGHLGLCQAPCTNSISTKKYKNEINRIKKFLSGESASLIKSLEKSMIAASKSQDYEAAAKYRDLIKKFKYLRTKRIIAQKYINNPYLVEDIREKSLNELVKALKILNNFPARIECYDISNISGKDAVGSMVVAINGEITKSNYRKFKIKTKSTPDDFYMMKEVLTRRLKRELFSSKKVKWSMPDLIVVDGGKGQVSAANDVLSNLNIYVPIVGIAKKNETLIFQDPSTLEFIEVVLPRSNEGLKLIQRLRDEAHRFAQAYHHKLRLKKI